MSKPKRSQGPYPQTDRDLIGRVERSAGSRAGYKQLVRELGLGGGRERRLLLEQLARITARGELVKINNEQWSIPRATPEKTARPSRNGVVPTIENRATRDRLLAGKLDLHRDGYGFVRPNGSTNRDDDLFIPPNEINGAMQGDEVLVDEAAPGRPGPDGRARRSGRVARVLTRRNPTVVGIFHYAKSQRRQSAWENAPLIFGNYVTPLDERMAQPILIPDGAEVPLAPKQTPHRVLGEEAQAQQQDWFGSDRPDPLEGLAVDIEVTDFPSLGKPAKGRVLEILGPPDAFGVDVEIVIRKHHLPHTFPANVLAEANESAALPITQVSSQPNEASFRPTEEASSQPTDEVSSRPEPQTASSSAAQRRDPRISPFSPTPKIRRDFRGLNIVTIDGETARDFDDAVLVTPFPNGNWELQVHIADVSHYVRPGTALDLEARLRGNSVYFPDRAIPMLPNTLSSGMCSLRPDEDRLVLSCLMEIDARGELLGYEVCEGIIRSTRRMTYTQIQSVLDGDEATREEFAPLVPEFERMYELALKLNAKRKRRGSIDFDLPEPVILFNPDGNMQAIVRSERGWSHRLIEEFMLSANECVAHWITKQGVPSIYRIHETPDPKRIVDFEETASQFGYSLGFSSLPVKRIQTRGDRRNVRGTDRKATTHEIPESIPVTPQMYQRLTAKIAGKPEERILAYLMLRSLKQARYSERNVGHFALASPTYTHFTSPIRRYPDLIVHRLIRDLLDRGANPQGGAILSDDPQPWSSEPSKKKTHEEDLFEPEAPIPEFELDAIASECSQTERRAADAERELIEGKKIKFMQDRVGEDFQAIVLSCTKYGFFVELDDLFIEGLVPLSSLTDDRYSFRDTDRRIVGDRNGKVFKMGMRVHVLLDRIDRLQRRLQFALLPSEKELSQQTARPRKISKTAATPEGDRPRSSPNRSGKKARKTGKTKSKTRLREKNPKGKRN